MEADTQAHVAFFLTGRRPSEYLDAVDGLDLRPALFAGYRDLTPLRYDFPLVLVARAAADGRASQSLSGLFDEALEKAAQGDDGERIRKHVLRLEQEIRALAAGGASGHAVGAVGRARRRGCAAQGDAAFEDSLQRAARGASRSTARSSIATRRCRARLLRHAWERRAGSRSRRSSARTCDRLVLKLSDILQADFERSDARAQRRALKASVGTGLRRRLRLRRDVAHAHQVAAARRMPAERRRSASRELLRVLKAQRFFAGDARRTRRAQALRLRVRQLRRRADRLSRAPAAS